MTEARALRRGRAAAARRSRPRPDRLRPRQHQQLRRLDRRPPASASRVPARDLRARRGRAARPAAAHDRALPVRAGRSGQPQRALRGGLQHPGPRPGDPAARDRHQEGRDRRLRRPGLHARADRRGARDGPARPAARERARLHDAGLRHQRPHEEQRVEADGAPRRDRARDRHPPVRDPDAARPRAPRRRGRARVRHHLRERPGGRAHLAPVPARQLPGRPGDRHRRPQRAGARLEHVRGRRPDVALRRQRLGAEVADRLPAALGDRHRAVRRRRRRGAAVGARHRDLAGADPVAARASRPPTARARSARTSCRTSSSSTSCASATGRARSRSWPSTPGASASAARGRT